MIKWLYNGKSGFWLFSRMMRCQINGVLGNRVSCRIPIQILRSVINNDILSMCRVCTPPNFCRKSFKRPCCGSKTKDQWLHLCRSSRRGQLLRQARAASLFWDPSMPTSRLPRIGSLKKYISLAVKCFVKETLSLKLKTISIHHRLSL